MVIGLLLAAGSGSRMGQPKAQIELNGERLVDRAVRIFKEAGIDQVYVVLGAWVGEVLGAQVLINEEWEEGMGSSLRCGLTAALLSPANEVVVSLVDLPGMTPAAISLIAQTPGELVMASYGGKKGHPAKFHRNHWSGIIESARGDVGARNYLVNQDSLLLVSLDDISSGVDIDTPEQLEKFQN
jgi:nicotine blue oxidoreductase